MNVKLMVSGGIVTTWVERVGSSINTSAIARGQSAHFHKLIADMGSSFTSDGV